MFTFLILVLIKQIPENFQCLITSQNHVELRTFKKNNLIYLFLDRFGRSGIIKYFKYVGYKITL